MKNRLIVFIASLIFTTSSIKAQKFDKVDAWLAENANEMGGRVMVMVYSKGEMVYAHAVNQLNAQQKAMNNFIAKRQGKTAELGDYTETTRQQIASCSKWFSAALIMTFVDDGKLKLTDTVGKFFPVLTKNGKGNITIAQCLSHTTGIKAPSLRESLSEFNSINNMEESVHKIALLPMEGIPGKVFHYSNDGLQIGGAIIEKISGKSFETLFAERIAKPLNMKNSDFGHDKVALPAGGAYSTPQDYMNFLIMILNKGTFNGKRILSEKSIEQMQINRVLADVKVAYAPAEAGNFGYGFGEWVVEAGANNVAKSVSSPGLFGSFPWVSNDKKYCGFLMAFNLKSAGRNQKYLELKNLVEECLK